MRFLKPMAATLLLAATVLLIQACESSDVLAPAGSQIIIEANPSTVVIDTDAGETEGTSLITVQLFDSTGEFPLQGVDVTFGTTGGRLTSSDNHCGQAGTCALSGDACSADADCPVVPARSVSTDDNGIARDTLTLALADPASVEVSVRSSTVAAAVTVEKTVVEGNVAPEAVIFADPSGGQQVDQFATFDGTDSSDPDGSITCYQWTINYKQPDGVGGTTDETLVVQGRSESRVSRRFAVEQTVSVLLRVSDSDEAVTFCADGAPTAPASSFSALTDSLNYPIVCDTTPPVAVAGPDPAPISLAGGGQVQLSAAGSSDPETGIAAYSWNCGNGQIFTTADVTCNYASTGTKTAVLTVTNGCGQTDTDDVRITVVQ